jgi:hypothetical protein
MQTTQWAALVTCFFFAGCASSSVMDVDANTMQISTSAAPACGAQGAQQVAVKRAAYETLRHGYDKYVILGGQAQNNVGVVGYTPVTANTYSNGFLSGNGNSATYSGNSQTYFMGGSPIIGGTHDQQLGVRMFKADDPQAVNAIDARHTLGPDWKKVMVKGPGLTCTS